MNEKKFLNSSYKYSKSLTIPFSEKKKNKIYEEDNNILNEFKRTKFSKSTMGFKLPKNFVPVLRPKKKCTKKLIPLFLNPKQEMNNSFEKNNINNFNSSSSDTENENNENENNNNNNNNNDFFGIKIYMNLNQIQKENLF